MCMGHEMNIFREAYKFKSVLSVHVHMVGIFLCCLVKRTINTEFLLASMESLTNSKNCSRKPHHNFCTGFPICYWPISSSVHIILDAGNIHVSVPVLGGFLYDNSGPKAGS